MTQAQTSPKSQLLDALRSSERDLLDRLAAVPRDQFEQGRYEGGWNGRQILAHIASMEWTYPRLIEVASEAASASAPKEPSPDLPSRKFRGTTSDYNQRQVDKRAQASVDDLLAEFRDNRAATIAAVEQADEHLFAVPIRSAGGVTGPLAAVMQAVAVFHILAHVNDIVAGAAKA